MDRLRFARLLLAVLGLAACLPAGALAMSPAGAVSRPVLVAVEPSSGSPVRLLSPVAGTPLVGGTTVELAWEPTPALARLAHVQEWEAFLSLDGGLSYPLRLTPHLDLDVQRIPIPLPVIATSDARLLLRLGDERDEIAVPLAQRFVIQAPSVFVPLAPAATSAALLGPPTVGEPALPHASGVLAWVEGTRRGQRLRLRVASGYGTLVPVAAPPAATPLSAALPPLDARVELAPPVTSATPRGPPRKVAAPAVTVEPRPGPDVRLLTQRQNE